ncbi:sensor histidine kinase [Anaerolinea sp.]|uniref:sensor histidine kinase n=1 Tax=Anaerolinea sp. TaxID=1872519 RepID=UPI002ACE2B5C|nr:sensor histidine kinase [Anaerolinea sp.]
MKTETPFLRTGTGVDLAFAVMVLAGYFTTFTSVRSLSFEWLTLMILLGIGYLTTGVYGYARVAHDDRLLIRVGYFLLQIPLGALSIILSGQVGFNAIILLPLVGHSVFLLPEAWKYLINLLIAFSYGAIVHLMTASWEVVWASVPVFGAGQVFILVFTQMMLNEEKARREIESLVVQLREANDRLREYAIQAEELAIVKERNRLAREIHDGLGHYLTTLNMQIKAASAVLETDLEAARQLLAKAEGVTHKALLDIRQSVRALRDPSLPVKSVEEILAGLLEECEHSGIHTLMEVKGEPRKVDQELKASIIRLVQESISNTLKHSKATLYQLVLDYQSDCIILEMKDNGVGGEISAVGFGLLGMQERVALLKGKMEIATTNGAGFSIKIILPG